MVQVIEGNNDWQDVGRAFGGGLVKGYQNRSDENAVRSSIEKLGPNPSARQILDAITKTKTYNPEAKQQVLKNYLGVEEFEEMKRKNKEAESIANARNDIDRANANQKITNEQQDRQNIRNIVNQLDIPQEKKETLGNSLSVSGAESLLKEQLKPKNGEEKLTPFQKKVQEKNAEEYINLTKEVPKIDSLIGDIDYAQQLSDDLGWSGLITGPLGISEKAGELEGVGFTLIEPIVKIFNPSGPIAQQKLKMIQDKYSIKATDTPITRKAKLAALRRFATQAKKRAQDKLELIKAYEGNVPEAEMKRFEDESNTVSDAILDYDLIGEEVNDERLPDAKNFKDKTVTSPEGEKFFSDGTRWIKR